MSSMVSTDRLRFLLKQLRERLWVRPLIICLLSIGMVFVAKLFDNARLRQFVPEITIDSVETLLSVMAASMLVIATFSVASMVSAYAAASNRATPRSFILVIADDASQNALSGFVGSFIFSIVAITAVKNDFYQTGGLFILFVVTALVFSMVIFTFVRWVDSIARLGRMRSTLDKVEKATRDALKRRRDGPSLPCCAVRSHAVGQAVCATQVGYVQHIDFASLQAWAEKAEGRVIVEALPGSFATPDQPLAYVTTSRVDEAAPDCTPVVEAFGIGTDRQFDDDPRFGLVVLAEIAGKALSPAVNDPGTAIDVMGRLVRLFHLWSQPATDGDDDRPLYDRVEVPEISVRDMFDDAFTVIARDGASQVEVSVWLQKALSTLASLGDEKMREAARHHRGMALERSRMALTLPEDLAAVRSAAGPEET
ncbi:DUF2254 domain-containing protein [Haliea sp. E1-2-M8]|uniref:DUF2254 domain-containing protein n=1 Tax=Haliea sp. E1-2-M8 TaxID=3064706 RepID=UPI002724283B|nr:DUF2254 domain-containing protein [Haliea sp. E1-2-M8]MDO8862731.1 DUF2254 domain-containing protein [Haliea sp. E1-2-M8]